MKRTEKRDEKAIYNVEVTRAHAFNDETVAFDMVVNGVTIYGCVYREYKNKNGKPGTIISFPSHKGNDGKYYSHAFFPISTELKNHIEKQLEAMI